MKTEVARFVEEMLGLIRHEFFAQFSDKRFFQERPLLIQAVTWPARWMNERGARAPPSMYRRIIQTVIVSLRRHGNRPKIRRFSVYFLHAVQEHMKHHGDEYYYEAKSARPISSILQSVERHARAVRVEAPATQVLSQLNSVLRSRGGRRRRDSSAGQLDLLPTSKTRKSVKLCGDKIDT